MLSKESQLQRRGGFKEGVASKKGWLSRGWFLMRDGL